MGDISVGGEVYTPDGRPTRVLGVYPKGIRPVYRVTLHDGSSTMVCNEHLWEVSYGDIYGKVIDTNELKKLVDSGVVVNLPTVCPVDYPETNDLPIDAYALGIILGRGVVNGDRSIGFACGNIDIVNELTHRGYDVVKSKRGHIMPFYSINNVNEALSELNLSELRFSNLFIPEMYLLAPIQVRQDLLRGLFDACARMDDVNKFAISSVGEVLASDIVALIRSLGGRAQYKKDDVFSSVYNVESYVVCDIQVPSYVLGDVALGEDVDNSVASVEYVFDDEVQCILVEDERHLFLVDDYIPTHNTSNIVFLKSTDDTMIDTLVKMSGTTHRVYKNSKSVSQDVGKVVMRNEGTVTYTMNTVEEPVIKYNDLAFLGERNSIIFNAGDNPIWNRNETILPMSWRLFKNTIEHPGHTYSLQTIPTLSSAKDFDILRNQPDYRQMFARREKQAVRVDECIEKYKAYTGCTDTDISYINQNTFADDILSIINYSINDEEAFYDESCESGVPAYEPEVSSDTYDSAVENVEQKVATAEKQRELEEYDSRKWCNGRIIRSNIVAKGGVINRNLEGVFLRALRETFPKLVKDTDTFKCVNEGNDEVLYLLDGNIQLVRHSLRNVQRDVDVLNQAAKDRNSSVYNNGDGELNVDDFTSYTIFDAFFIELSKMERWDFADGDFERAVIDILNQDTSPIN